MTPLQRIGMGWLIVIIPAHFPAHPEPEWAFYDALPPPLGWLLILSGLYGLRRQLAGAAARSGHGEVPAQPVAGGSQAAAAPTGAASFATEVVRLMRWPTLLAWIAAAVSVPLWFPQLNHRLTPAYNPEVGESWQWFFSQPPLVFGFVLSVVLAHSARRARRLVTEATSPDSLRWLELVGLTLAWGFAAAVVLPPITFGADITWLLTPTLVSIGASQVGLAAVLLWHHRTLANAHVGME